MSRHIEALAYKRSLDRLGMTGWGARAGSERIDGSEDGITEAPGLVNVVLHLINEAPGLVKAVGRLIIEDEEHVKKDEGHVNADEELVNAVL